MSTLSPHILTFVTLLLMHDGVNGVQITGLSLRNGRGGGGNGPGPPTTTTTATATSRSSSSKNNPINIPPSTTSPSPSHIPGTSQISTLPSSSPLPTSTSNPGVRLANLRHVGTVVGAVLGSVVLAGLGLMALAYYRRRAGKARKRPTCSVYLSEPQTEMSQTQNSPPLTSSAPLLHRPVPLHFFNASSRDNPPSFLPADNSRDTTSHSTSELDSDFDVPSDPLQSPYDTQPFLLLDIARPEAGNTSSSTSDQLSPLHHVMEGFQEALEVNHKRDISYQSDSPPKYIS